MGDIENNTWTRGDMEFIFECSYRYRTSEISNVNTSVHVLFCLLYKHTNNDVFDDFPKISDHFPKISEDFPKLFRRLDERLQTFSEHFPKITEDCRR